MTELMDVAVVALGIDARARPKIQRAMDDIASRGDTKAKQGLSQMLREAIRVLRAEEASWTHASAQNAKPMPPQDAQRTFLEAAQRARSRYQTEVVRNFAGVTTRAPAPPLPESDEPGRVVVTLVVAGRRELRDALGRDRESFEAVLDDIVALRPEELVAMEVVWSPAAEADRMSLDAMLARYPELFPLS